MIIAGTGFLLLVKLLLFCGYLRPSKIIQTVEQNMKCLSVCLLVGFNQPTPLYISVELLLFFLVRASVLVNTYGGAVIETCLSVCRFPQASTFVSSQLLTDPPPDLKFMFKEASETTGQFKHCLVSLFV